MISAVFDSRNEAESALRDLRAAGVRDNAISVIANKEHGDLEGHHTEHAEGEVRDVVGKTAAGAGVGALLGVAALAIPGVGPLIAGGAIAEAAIGGAALTGTAVGAAAGGLAGLLTDHGVDEEDARYYEGRINEGGIFVSVDETNAGTGTSDAQEILYRNGGHSSRRARAV